MGFLKDIRTLNRQAKEIRKDWDPAAQLAAGMQQMQAASRMMEQQTAALQLGATGEVAQAQVVAARETGMQLNLQPVLDIDLLVHRDGVPPYPVTVRRPVAQAHLGRLVPGTVLPARVDPANPATVHVEL